MCCRPGIPLFFGAAALLASLALLALLSRRAQEDVHVIGPQDSLPDALANVRRIVTLGDSITQAGGEPGGYVSLFTERLNRLYPARKWEVLNAGISGHRSTEMLARFQRDVLDRKPDLVTISVGINDVWHGFTARHPRGDGPRGVPLPLFREKVEAMIEAAQKAGARVAIFSTTVIHEYLDSLENQKLAAYNQALRALAQRHDCLFIDLNTAFHKAIRDYRAKTGKTDNRLTTDGVHMNSLGNRLMAYTLLRGLGVPDRDLADLQDRLK